MTAAPTLEQRIAAYLDGDPQPPAAASELRRALDERTRELRSALAAAEAEAVDPRASWEATEEARKRADRLAFDIRRALAAADAVDRRAVDLAAEERLSAAMVEYEAARIERDELATELKATYPKLTAKLIDLFDRLETSNRRVLQANREASVESPFLEDAETVARGFRPGVGGTWTLASAVRLFDFGRDSQPTWPRPYRPPQPIVTSKPPSEPHRRTGDLTPSLIPLT